MCEAARGFLDEIDSMARTQVIEQYARWNKPQQLTVETIRTKGIYRPTIRPSKDPALRGPIQAQGLR